MSWDWDAGLIWGCICPLRLWGCHHGSLLRPGSALHVPSWQGRDSGSTGRDPCGVGEGMGRARGVEDMLAQPQLGQSKLWEMCNTLWRSLLAADQALMDPSVLHAPRLQCPGHVPWPGKGPPVLPAHLPPREGTPCTAGGDQLWGTALSFTWAAGPALPGTALCHADIPNVPD